MDVVSAVTRESLKDKALSLRRAGRLELPLHLQVGPGGSLMAPAAPAWHPEPCPAWHPEPGVSFTASFLIKQKGYAK